MKTTCNPATLFLLGMAIVLTSTATTARGQDAYPDAKNVKVVLNKAISYLKTAQNEDGSYVPKLAGPGVGALIAVGLLRNGVGADEPVVAKSFKYLQSRIKKDGGIYDKFLANYTTSVAVMALQEANTKGQYEKIIKDATAFLRNVQHIDPESSPDDPKFGGFGYDKNAKTNPDASNTAFAVEALIAAGVPKNDPAIQKALKFLSRCQNLPKESNDQPFAKKASPDDLGGITYSPINPDKSEYKTDDGGLRSLGSMTYGGLKSFLYAGVSKDDPRVKAALDWVRKHYTLDSNPGLGQAGLYYYYHTFAKAMDALGEDTFTDAKGKKHYWRQELFEALKKRQQPDGSWVNETKHFGEGAPEVATAFAVLSLSYCQPKGKQ
jgi:squalene-hopene/tetraprenyl-beta-curcumene cyclase